MGRHALLQGIFPAQGSNLGLLHCRLILYQLSHQGSSKVPQTGDLKTEIHPFLIPVFLFLNTWCGQGCLSRGFGASALLAFSSVSTSFSPGLLPLHPVVAVVQLLSRVRLLVTPWTTALQASLSFTVSQSLLKFTSIESVIPSNHLIPCHPLLFLPSIFPSIRVFSNELAHRIRWPKYWSFSFNISPFNEYSGLISFRMDWFDLLSWSPLLQRHSC